MNEFPSLKKYAGQTLVTTDGTTLLGADDRAGVAEIITLAAYLKEHPEIKHGQIQSAWARTKKSGPGPITSKCSKTLVPTLPTRLTAARWGN